MVAAVLVSPWCGKLLDRGPRRPLLFAGCLLSALAALAFLHVTQVGWYLYAARGLQGAAYTLYFVAAATYVADLSPASRLGQALGWFGCAGLAMNAVATLIAERIAQTYGWHGVFYSAAAAGLLGAIITLFLREPPAKPKHTAAALSASTSLPWSSTVLPSSAIAVARGTWTADEHATLVRLLDQMGPLPAITRLDADAVVAATRRDKKVVAGTLHFVLPTRIGDTTIATDVDEAQVRLGLREIGIGIGD